jgi:hypothetical protein
VFHKRKVKIRNFGVIILVLFSALNVDTLLFAQKNDEVDQSAQAPDTTQREPAASTKRPSRKRRRTVRRKKCMQQSSSEAKKSEETKPSTMEAPALILDPTDRDPGPPKEIIPKYIDPAEMPIKKPPKKKTKPQ